MLQLSLCNIPRFSSVELLFLGLFVQWTSLCPHSGAGALFCLFHFVSDSTLYHGNKCSYGQANSNSGSLTLVHVFILSILRLLPDVAICKGRTGFSCHSKLPLSFCCTKQGGICLLLITSSLSSLYFLLSAKRIYCSSRGRLDLFLEIILIGQF